MKQSKWHLLIHSPERVMVLTAIINRIRIEAERKGLSSSNIQFTKLLNAQGVNVSRSYFYCQMKDHNTHPFPVEAIIAICKGYGIPLDTIFNPELFTDLPIK